VAHWIIGRRARYALKNMRTLILILLVACSVATAAEVYRWVDDDGEVHYSDRPHEGAEMVVLPKAQTFSAPKPRARRRDSDAAKDIPGDRPEAVGYQLVEIVSPTPNEVLWSTGGLVKVSVRVLPELRSGHTLMIYLNDQMVEGLTGNEREMELTEVFRGEHTLRAEVRGAGGGIVANGNSVTFTVQQTSIQNPNNPNVPRPTPR
jgi:hypothetical protein